MDWNRQPGTAVSTPRRGIPHFRAHQNHDATVDADVPQNDGLGSLRSPVGATQDESDASLGFEKVSQRLIDADPEFVASEVGDHGPVGLPLVP
jgi:hypothetical protein